MSNYSNILAAVDFSSSAELVVAKANQIAKRNNAKLCLLYIVEYMPPIDFDIDPLLASNWMVEEDVLVANARQALEKLSKKCKLNTAELVVELGTAKHEITKYVEEHQCDLVVMGSHGRHGISLLLGSTANAVLHAMPCDILTVKLK
jgi:universal stress protein A